MATTNCFHQENLNTSVPALMEEYQQAVGQKMAEDQLEDKDEVYQIPKMNISPQSECKLVAKEQLKWLSENSKA